MLVSSDQNNKELPNVQPPKRKKRQLIEIYLAKR